MGFWDLSGAAKLFLGVVLVILFEGALRKWLLPSLGNPLMLLRDAMAMAMVAGIFAKGQYRRAGILLQLLAVWSAIVIMWGLVQVLILQTPLLVFMLGVRFWLLYLWMALGVAVALSDKEIRYILQLMAWTLVLMAPLAVMQFLSPPGHWINFQPDTDEDHVFVSAMGIVRTSGTFSFTLGYACYIAMMAPFALAPRWGGANLFAAPWMRLLLVACVAVASLVSGSRSALLYFVTFAVFYFFSEMSFSARASDRFRTLMTAMVFVLILAAVVLLLPNILLSMQERFLLASQSEDFAGRIFSIFLGEPGALARFSWLGYGLGAGTNGAQILLTGENYFSLAESEPGRVLLEMGAIGGLWLFLKISLLTWGLGKSWHIAATKNDIMPICLWFSSAFAIMTWPISGQVSAHGIAYVLLAFSLRSVLKNNAGAR
jgi:hypothetical protein